jgi:hypothetical protein
MDALPSDTTLSAAHEPRQQAIWPWVLMPLVVLLVAFTLNHLKDVAQSAAAQSQAHSPTTATTGGANE